MSDLERTSSGHTVPATDPAADQDADWAQEAAAVPRRRFRRPAPAPAPGELRTRPRIRKLRFAAIAAGLGLLAAVSTVFGMMMALASDLPALENRPVERNSVLVDVGGRPLGLLTGNQNRVLIRGEEISPAMKHAIIAVEDRRFYEHKGVDVRAVGRALSQDVLSRRAVQGGSTIAQQFVKNALAAQEDRTLFTKLREAALAYHLTRKWSKEKILTEYLNAIYFGNGAYGIESAARTYFGSAHPGCGERGAAPCASELEPHEAALIAGVVSNPTAYDPLSNPRSALARRELVLERMVQAGYLSAAQLRDARAQALPGRDDVEPPAEKSAYPYFATWVKQQVVDQVGARRAFGGGLRVRTTLDRDLQEAAEKAVANRLSAPSGPQASMVVIDNRTGEVRAMVGGRDYAQRPFNLATQGQRQPGSAFKPFVLAAALESGIAPGSVWESRKREFAVPNTRGREAFVVNNYEDQYAGLTTLSRATTFSDNAVYAQVGIKVGTRKIARIARRMGVRTPVSRNYAMILGGLQEGVTPLDMAHAYLTIADGGSLVTGTLSPDGPGAVPGPAGIRDLRLPRRRGEKEGRAARLGDGSRAVNRPRRRRVLSARTAATMSSIMQTVVSSGTARAASLGPGEFAAGKTGTTENYGDAWFVGFTRRYTAAVWVGYPDRLRAMETEYRGEPVAGGTFPAEIWRDFMQAARALEDERSQTRLDRENARRARQGEPGVLAIEPGL